MNRAKREVQRLVEKGFCLEKDFKLQQLNRALLADKGLRPLQGVIHFGAQLDRTHWIADAREQGHAVCLVGERALIY